MNGALSTSVLEAMFQIRSSQGPSLLIGLLLWDLSKKVLEKCERPLTNGSLPHRKLKSWKTWTLRFAEVAPWLTQRNSSEQRNTKEQLEQPKDSFSSLWIAMSKFDDSLMGIEFRGWLWSTWADCWCPLSNPFSFDSFATTKFGRWESTNDNLVSLKIAISFFTARTQLGLPGSEGAIAQEKCENTRHWIKFEPTCSKGQRVTLEHKFWITLEHKKSLAPAFSWCPLFSGTQGVLKIGCSLVANCDLWKEYSFELPYNYVMAGYSWWAALRHWTRLIVPENSYELPYLSCILDFLQDGMSVCPRFCLPGGSSDIDKNIQKPKPPARWSRVQNPWASSSQLSNHGRQKHTEPKHNHHSNDLSEFGEVNSTVSVFLRQGEVSEVSQSKEGTQVQP